MVHVLRAARALVVAVALVAVVAPLPRAGATGVEWNVARIGAPMSATGIVVAVLDTGIDASHPTFDGRVLPEIVLTRDGRTGDPNGHGTHVAGTVGGGSAGPGIGVAAGVQLLPIRVLDADGAGTSAIVADGIRRAADEGAHVINLSLGSDVLIRTVLGSGLESAIRYAWDKGSIPVLAAGNNDLFGALLGSGYGTLPAVVVTATDHRDRAPSYANSIGSARWGIAAPGGNGSTRQGEDILSALPGGRYGLAAGTSMATPHVSGALAVLRNLGLTPAQAVEQLLDTARDVGPRSTYGAGLVDLAAATEGLARSAGGTTPPTVAATPAVPNPPVTAAAPEPAPAPAPPATTAPTPPPPTSEAPTTSTEPTTTTGPPPTRPTTTTSPVEVAAPVPPGPGAGDPVPAMAAVAALAACTMAWVLAGRAALARRRP